MINVISLFTGCGGLDLGFIKAGFNIVWANEYDKTIWPTIEKNFPEVHLDKRSIVNIKSNEIPNSFGIIGGPPCQSWSEAGALRGLKDPRGKLMLEYVRIIKEKEPLFFLAENVSGILMKRHEEAFQYIISKLRELNYNVKYHLMNAKNYNVPQDRKRVIIVGYHKKMGIEFFYPVPSREVKTLKNAIFDLVDSPVPANNKNKSNINANVLNHEYMNGGFSTIYMSRNRVRSWEEPSFTIQAGGRHAPIHPQAPKMILVGKDKRIFIEGKENSYRRLTVRECARIQTFPDSFEFVYDSISDGYKMVGNAVPVEFAKVIAKKIFIDINNYILKNNNNINEDGQDIKRKTQRNYVPN